MNAIPSSTAIDNTSPPKGIVLLRTLRGTPRSARILENLTSKGVYARGGLVGPLEA